MPTINLEPDTFSRVQSLVTALMTADQVIARLLDMAGVPQFKPAETKTGAPAVAQDASRAIQVADTTRAKVTSPRQSTAVPGWISRHLDRVEEPLLASGRARRGSALPREIFTEAILRILAEAGGQASTDTVRERMEASLGPYLTEVDRSPMPSTPQDPRWWNHARFARADLLKDGLVVDGSRKGIWALTAKGLAEANRRLSNG